MDKNTSFIQRHHASPWICKSLIGAEPINFTFRIQSQISSYYSGFLNLVDTEHFPLPWSIVLAKATGFLRFLIYHLASTFYLLTLLRACETERSPTFERHGFRTATGTGDPLVYLKMYYYYVSLFVVRCLYEFIEPRYAPCVT